MMVWLRTNVTLQNILIALTLASTLVLNSARWMKTLGENDRADADQRVELTRKVDDLSTRVSALERSNYQLFDVIAREFPRRSELDPRLKAIEDKLAEQNMMFRRYLESYRR